jgi:outer membrane protein insertion porin family
LKRISTYIAILSLLSSCSGLKHVPHTEKLYTGAKIILINKEKVSGTGKVKSSLSDVIRPKPNSKFLGMRLGLWFYYAMGTPRRPKGARAWIKKHIGEEPVYLSSVDTILETKALNAKLYNTGFLDSYNSYKINEAHHGKAASITYTVNLKSPYTIKEIIFPNDSTPLNKAISKTQKKTLLKAGDRYSLDVLLSERKRIDQDLKQQGYYYFSSDYILYAMDTGLGSRHISLRATVKKTTPEKAQEVYSVGRIDVYPDYKISTASIPTDTINTIVDSAVYHNQTNYIRPKAVMHAIFFRPGHIYDSRIHNLTLSHLNGLNVFKYINIDIVAIDSIILHELAVKVLLMPLQKKAVRAEFDLATKSNNFTGPSLTLSLRNRNAFKGAELVVYKLSTSFETQFSGQYKGLFTYEIDPGIQLNIPRILTFVPVRTKSNYVPHTQIEFDYSYLSRVGYFNLNSFKASFGYNWKTSPEITHDLKPVSVTYYNIYNTTQQFQDLINRYSYIKRRFENQFIAGLTYSFTYNEQVKTAKKNQFYFNANVDLSGNTLSLLDMAINKRVVNPSSTLIGVNFAQYARFDIDIRDYYHVAKSTFAFRIIAGWGRAYGSSSTLPYEKQFFSGGAYSVRGFPAYSLGPGSYIPPDSTHNIFYLQQGGEIKLETTVEYRFPIIQYLKGAIFADAGNTWLNKANPDIPNGEFKFNRFYKQIALSTGAGLRVDLNFFVVRLDVGIPLYRPGFTQPWVVNHTNFNSLEFNFAFGYPF